MTKAEAKSEYIRSWLSVVNSVISVRVASINNPPDNPEGNMSIIATASSLDAVVQEYAFPDVHIGPGEDESPYVPYVENVFIRHLAFDVRNNMYANILWVN